MTVKGPPKGTPLPSKPEEVTTQTTTSTTAQKTASVNKTSTVTSTGQEKHSVQVAQTSSSVAGTQAESSLVNDSTPSKEPSSKESSENKIGSSEPMQSTSPTDSSHEESTKNDYLTAQLTPTIKTGATDEWIRQIDLDLGDQSNDGQPNAEQLQAQSTVADLDPKPTPSNVPIFIGFILFTLMICGGVFVYKDQLFRSPIKQPRTLTELTQKKTELNTAQPNNRAQSGENQSDKGLDNQEKSSDVAVRTEKSQQKKQTARSSNKSSTDKKATKANSTTSSSQTATKNKVKNKVTQKVSSSTAHPPTNQKVQKKKDRSKVSVTSPSSPKSVSKKIENKKSVKKTKTLSKTTKKSAKRRRRYRGQPGLDAATIGQVVQNNSGSLTRCYQNLAKKDPTLDSIRTTLRFTVAPNGRSDGSDLTLSGKYRKTKLESCVRMAVKRWYFPKAERPSNVTYPLNFKSSF